MNTSGFVSNETSVVIVSLNVTETNGTFNQSFSKVLKKSPDEDSSLNNIIFGIGLVVVILIILVIIIKLIYKCYKMYHEDDNDDDNNNNNNNNNNSYQKDQVNKSPLLPSQPGANVRRNSSVRNSSVRNPFAPIHRSSLNLETQMEIRQKRLSQPVCNTPPISKKS